MKNAQSWFNEKFLSERKKNLRNLNIKEKDLIGSLKIKGLTNIKKLDCSNNQITQLEIINCPNLKEISCNNNQLRELNLSNYPHLKVLNCSQNQLTNLNLAGLRNLRKLCCFDNQLTKLNLGGCSDLEEISCQKNQLIELETSNCPRLEKINCDDNQLTKLNLGTLKELIGLRCADNRLIELDLAGSLNLEKLDCSCNFLTKLDLSRNTQLEELDISSNKFQEQVLNFLTHLIRLEKLELNNNNFIGSLWPLRNMFELKKLNISGTDIDRDWEYLTDNLAEFYCSNQEEKDCRAKEIEWKLSEKSGCSASYSYYKTNQDNSGYYHRFPNDKNFARLLQNWKRENPHQVKVAQLTKLGAAEEIRIQKVSNLNKQTQTDFEQPKPIDKAKQGLLQTQKEVLQRQIEKLEKLLVKVSGFKQTQYENKLKELKFRHQEIENLILNSEFQALVVHKE